MKRMVTLQDISCIGKCSLTVALPIISAMGTETAVIPTAVLSAHTAFDGFTFHDLTDEIEPVAKHWKSENIDFSCIYTGYLGSERQLDIVYRFINDFREGASVFIDPVMGDFGRLYSGFDLGFASQMKKLCSVADVIVPNMTEACYLLGIPFIENVNEKTTRDILKKLCSLGAKNAILTGVIQDNNKIGAMGYNSEKDEYFSAYSDRIDASFHGTGDIFASVCVGALCRGKPLPEALRLAVDFTSLCIKLTIADPDHRWYGVNFEAAIPWLTQNM